METPFNNTPSEQTASVKRIAINVGAVAIGAVVTFGFVKWQDQQSKIAELSDMVTQMQQTPVQAVAPQADVTTAMAPAPVAADVDVVSRNATVDLTAISDATATLATAVPEELSAADQINAIMAQPEAALGSDAVINATRLETLAIIDAGVQELVEAVVAGEYDIHTDYADDDFSGRIHFEFVRGAAGEQEQLERFIAQAAEDGIIAHSGSVVGSDGSVNGHIMLFDLVERSMENGTIAEQRAVQRMQQQAVALLNETADVGEPLNAQGEQYYVVENGDSLAYIAFQFYGNTNSYLRIFEANRSQLSSPERIRVGQRLFIPQI